MALQFCSFASGSSGNCYLIKKDETAILVDVGISGKRVFQGLAQTDTLPEQVVAILLSHEHSDHVKSLPLVSKKTSNSKVYANQKTWDHLSKQAAQEKLVLFETGQDFYIEGIRVRPFAVPHDAAEPVGFSFYAEDEGAASDGESLKQISILTDAGHVTEAMFQEILGADLLVLEANHEVEVLRMSNYPYPLQQRILGELGHLSNVTTADCICKLHRAKDKVRQILLGHLSRQNNDPALAQLTIQNILQEQEIYLGDRLKMEVILRDSASAVYEV